MEDRERQQMSRLMPGLILIGLGVLFLLAQFFPIGDWFLLILGLAFLASYFLTRRDGLLWPAGVLTGLGTAILVSERLRLDGPLQAASILLGLSAGFFAIYVIDQLYTPPTPAAPLWAGLGTGLAGVIFVLIGLGVLSESVWGLIGQLWPLALIVAGIAVIFGALRPRA
jgi:hypothetical protein